MAGQAWPGRGAEKSLGTADMAEATGGDDKGGFTGVQTPHAPAQLLWGAGSLRGSSPVGLKRGLVFCDLSQRLMQ